MGMNPSSEFYDAIVVKKVQRVGKLIVLPSGAILNDQICEMSEMSIIFPGTGLRSGPRTVHKISYQALIILMGITAKRTPIHAQDDGII